MARRSQLHGADGVEKVLRGLGREIGTKVVLKALMAGGRILAADWKARVRRRTGELMKSIVVRKATGRQLRRGSGHVVVGFRKGPSRIAHLVEWGTRHSRAFPFMRPGIDARADEMLRKIAEVLRVEITVAAERLAGRFSTSGLARRRRRR